MIGFDRDIPDLGVVYHCLHVCRQSEVQLLPTAASCCACLWLVFCKFAVLLNQIF
jgi:hypothetical protein